MRHLTCMYTLPSVQLPLGLACRAALHSWVDLRKEREEVVAHYQVSTNQAALLQ
jgi:hypothetical protein